ncbi:c-type cytochrome biogenesis protein CcsB [Cyanobacteria bacterium FACHB-DQ100]|uniref:c-type cytochrome biogenesis protein CcsB n=1 Tax=unclassified Leptolyngbya TaxID=2650499 RepID=UPI0016800A9D|nr:c-type cytochrome biogenesis protein CcsB [Leptolyngbya sp. FACHB-17]MBD1824680.1 c-type cytochrome biogenesis protein CcsB [Cyanobacteria bacterium FACHB-DQ100]MBD2079978.1 c-type cytochrome biogenesis protein CcsB [Leptolyngbya sp. FACHB-17]
MDLVALQGILDNLSFAVLFATMLIYWVGAAFPQIPYASALGTAGMAIANLSTATLLAARWIEAGYFPLSNLYESLFFLVWGITTMHLIAENMSKSKLVGVVTAPVAMAITAFAALTLPDTMQASAPLVPALKSNWLMMHVSVMMLSYATLMVGSLLAIAFLVITRGQNIELRGSSIGTGSYREKSYQLHRSEEMNANSGGTAVLERTTLSPQRLTLADTLDNISYRVIGLGFPLLTIGIIAGGVWANEAWGSYWSWDPKETWAFITWLVFAAYLHARITKGWQGRRPAILAAVGFVVVWVCYLGVNLLGKGLHSYGWFL